MGVPVISNIVVKPNLYGALKVTASTVTWTPDASPTGQLYLVAQATETGTGTIRTYETPISAITTNYINCGVFNQGTEQTFAVWFRDSKTPTHNTSGVSTTQAATFTASSSLPAILRQQLCQIISDNPVTVDGITAKLLQDTYFRPVINTQFPQLTMGVAPLIEIGMAEITQEEQITPVQYRTAVKVEINVWTVDKDITNANERLFNFRAQLRKQIDSVSNLGLSILGVMNGSWEFESEEAQNLEDETNTCYVLPVSLTVIFNRLA